MRRAAAATVSVGTPGTCGSHRRVMTWQARPWTVFGRDSRQAAQTAGVISSADSGGAARVAA